MTDVSLLCSDWLKSIGDIRDRLVDFDKQQLEVEPIDFVQNLDEIERTWRDLQNKDFPDTQGSLFETVQQHSLKLEGMAKEIEDCPISADLRSLSLKFLCGSPQILGQQIEKSLGSVRLTCGL